VLTGCPSFPDPVRLGEGDTTKQQIDSSQPDLPLPDLPIKPDAPPIMPDAPLVPDTTQGQPIGANCGVGAHCQSGYCADYTCCDKPCVGPCEACNVPGSVGTCTFVPNGDDLRHDCTASPTNTCGDDGACDGMGACRKWSAGTSCAKPNCSSYNHELSNVKACDGKGNCTPAPNIKCDPFSCSTSTDTCYTSCTGYNEGYTCQGYYGCNSSGTCYTTCSWSYQCTSSGDCKWGKCVKDDNHWH
jgi:hypothetical protein